jgi:hypothetical protein
MADDTASDRDLGDLADVDYDEDALHEGAEGMGVERDRRGR